MRMICDSHAASWSFQSTRVPGTVLCTLSLSYCPGDMRSHVLYQLHTLYQAIYYIYYPRWTGKLRADGPHDGSWSHSWYVRELVRSTFTSLAPHPCCKSDGKVVRSEQLVRDPGMNQNPSKETCARTETGSDSQDLSHFRKSFVQPARHRKVRPRGDHGRA